MSLARVVVPAALALGLASPPPIRPVADQPRVTPNDNRTPAGRLAGDSLFVSLEIRMAEWYPEKPDGPHVRVAAFAEEGKSAMVPGPLIRVPTGTVIVATLRNSLSDSAVTIRGLHSRPEGKDSGITLKPGERTTVQFPAGVPGTYFYDADVGVQSEDVEREQLAGAFIVDPVGGAPPDRVFVLNIWGGAIDSANTWGNALAINGRSWPYTERIGVTVGDSIRWRVINASIRPHPMHLHGVYFRMDARGSMHADTAFSPEERPLVVTNSMPPGQTMNIVWRPDRPGNWLFHCHLMFHATGDARLGKPADHFAHSGDPDRHMAGLVLGIFADPRPGDPLEAREDPRHITLEISEARPRGRAGRRLGFAMLHGDPQPGDTVSVPGPLLVLTRGQPTDILVRNRLPEATAIHWHGIELESWSDGVPGWSGIGDRRAPSIAPGDSFTARLTLPRAGTFMYHTHLNDIEQVTSGMYGPIVVVEPGKKFDPSFDHVFLVSWDGAGEGLPHRMVNGDSLPRTETLERGTHRLRFVNIGPADAARFQVVRDSVAVPWRLVAKDGAEVGPSRRVPGTAQARIDVGETMDYEFDAIPGQYDLMFGRGASRRLVRHYIIR